MEQELQKKDLPEMGLRQNLIAAITSNGGIDISRVDKLKINLELKKYKHQSGVINFEQLFLIPTEERITALATKDFAGTIQTITVALTLAFESMNLSRAITAFQILDLAEAIVDEADGDKLSLEDLMLFLQKLVRGEYPGLFEGMDIPKFMERFNKFRDDRWNAGVAIRKEKELYYRTLGDQERTTQSNPIADHLTDFAGRISDMKEKLKEKNEIIKNYKKYD